MVIVKKRLGSLVTIQYAVLKFTSHRCFAHARNETLKLFISLFLLLANLYFQVLSNLVKTRLLLHISYTLETFHKSSVTTSKISEVIDDSFVAEIWSFMTFRGGFLIITSKLIKPEASFFSGCYFISLSILLLNLLFIS